MIKNIYKMDSELTEEEKENFEKANLILSYIFSIFNLLIVIFSLFLLTSKKKKYKNFKI